MYCAHFWTAFSNHEVWIPTISSKLLTANRYKILQTCIECLVARNRNPARLVYEKMSYFKDKGILAEANSRKELRKQAVCLSLCLWFSLSLEYVGFYLCHALLSSSVFANSPSGISDRACGGWGGLSPRSSFQDWSIFLSSNWTCWWLMAIIWVCSGFPLSEESFFALGEPVSSDRCQEGIKAWLPFLKWRRETEWAS